MSWFNFSRGVGFYHNFMMRVYWAFLKYCMECIIMNQSWQLCVGDSRSRLKFKILVAFVKICNEGFIITKKIEQKVEPLTRVLCKPIRAIKPQSHDHAERKLLITDWPQSSPTPRKQANPSEAVWGRKRRTDWRRKPNARMMCGTNHSSITSPRVQRKGGRRASGLYTRILNIWRLMYVVFVKRFWNLFIALVQSLLCWKICFSCRKMK